MLLNEICPGGTLGTLRTSIVVLAPEYARMHPIHASSPSCARIPLYLLYCALKIFLKPHRTFDSPGVAYNIYECLLSVTLQHGLQPHPHHSEVDTLCDG